MGKGDETRKAILQTSLSMASRLGLDGLSIGGLAKKMGMSKSGLFAHFSSKEQLQLQVLHLAVERFIETVMAPAIHHPRGEPRVRALFETWLAWEDAKFLPGGCIFISTANELDDRPGVLRDYLVEEQKNWLNGIARAAALGVEEGHFRADLDTLQFAYDFYSIALAYHHFSRLLKDRDAGERARRSFETLIQSSKA
jgi:AcrR family transcriptional regulator